MTGARFIDRYRVERPLGTGAEGAVYLVADPDRNDARRALKLVRGVDPGARERLAGEFLRLAALDHPHLVRVFDLETTEDGAPFFTAEYIDGTAPGRRYADAGGDRLNVLLDLAEDIASALAHIHAAGLLHSDVKPDNILIRETGGAVLLDLGLSTARAVGGAARGSLAYMSREALAGTSDPRADLYALGATLYEIATGRPPFAGDTPAELIRSICEDTPVSIRALAPELPQPATQLIEKLLARDPGARHSSAQVLLDDLARVRESLGVAPRDVDRAPAVDPMLLPPALIGRDDAVSALIDVLRRVASPDDVPPSRSKGGKPPGAPPPIVRLVGPAG